MDIYFYGSYECKADAKGRVMLPVALKNQITPVLNSGFFIKHSMMVEGCLELYPFSEWNLVMQELNSKSRFDEENLDLIRKFTAGLRPVEIDGAGRLLISKSLITKVGITKDVVLASMGKYIEIWDKDLYENKIKSKPGEVAKLAKKLMVGEKSNDELS